MATTITSTGDSTDRKTAIENAIAADPDRAVYLPAGGYSTATTFDLTLDNSKIILGDTAEMTGNTGGTLTSTPGDVKSDKSTIVVSGDDCSVVWEDETDSISSTAGPQLHSNGMYGGIVFLRVGSAYADRSRAYGLRIDGYRYKGLHGLGADPNCDEIYLTSTEGNGATETIFPQPVQFDPGARRTGGYGTCRLGRIVIGPHPNAGTLGGGCLKFSWYPRIYIGSIEYVGPYAAPNGYSLILGELIEDVRISKATLPGGIAQFPDIGTSASNASLFSETVINYVELNDCLIGQGANHLSRTPKTELVTHWNRCRVRSLVARRVTWSGVQRSAIDETHSVTVDYDNPAYNYADEADDSVHYASDYIQSRYYEDCIVNTYDATDDQGAAPRFIQADDRTASNSKGKIRYVNTRLYASDGSAMPASNNADYVALWGAA